MKFMDDVISYSIGVWEDCANERFLTEMANGTLSKEKFLDYIIQDSLYLRDYLKAFAYAITKCNTLKEMQIFYSILGYVNDSENTTRLNYLKEHNLTDADVDKMAKKRQCKDYTNFLIKTSQNGTIEDILMATLPCMLGYNYVFESLKAKAPYITKGYFANLVNDYTSEMYKKCCNYWKSIANEMCEKFDKNKKTELKKIFYNGSFHELCFWQMAGEDKIYKS